MAVRVVDVTRERRAAFAARIQALEAGQSYPLGDDRFEIDHGEDYFAFFDRLGEVLYLAAVDGDEVVAVGAGMLRQVPRRAGAPLETVWYGADLKVRPSHRRQRIPWAMFSWAFPRHYPRCGRGYGISMDPPDRENPVVRMCRRFGLAPMSVGTTLFFYSVDAPTMAALEPLVRAHRGPLAYRSLRGVKDIVLQSTGAPMPLLHLQHGPCAAPGGPAPRPGHVHMFCSPVDDPLTRALFDEGFTPSATASVIQHRMGGWDWSFVLTSDI